MERLWAPWRIQYILGNKKATACVLCSIANETNDEENLILYRSRHCFLVLNLFPYNDGHLMISPYTHTGVFTDLSPEELLDIMNITKIAVSALESTFHPEGYNIGMNLGAVSGAGIPDHLHMHVVPRWRGDTNFMPVLGQTKIINQLLKDSYIKIKQALDLLQKNF